MVALWRQRLLVALLPGVVVVPAAMVMIVIAIVAVVVIMAAGRGWLMLSQGLAVLLRLSDT